MILSFGLPILDEEIGIGCLPIFDTGHTAIGHDSESAREFGLGAPLGLLGSDDLSGLVGRDLLDYRDISCVSPRHHGQGSRAAARYSAA